MPRACVKEVGWLRLCTARRKLRTYECSLFSEGVRLVHLPNHGQIACHLVGRPLPELRSWYIGGT